MDDDNKRHLSSWHKCKLLRCKVCGNFIKKKKDVSWNKYKKKKYCGHKCQGKAFTKIRKGKRNPNWKGNKVGYAALHEWIKGKLKEPKLCQKCGVKKSYDLANISQKYKRDLKDWEYLCRKCHMEKDGRIKNLKQYCKKISI